VTEENSTSRKIPRRIFLSTLAAAGFAPRLSGQENTEDVIRKCKKIKYDRNVSMLANAVKQIIHPKLAEVMVFDPENAPDFSNAEQNEFFAPIKKLFSKNPEKFLEEIRYEKEKLMAIREAREAATAEWLSPPDTRVMYLSPHNRYYDHNASIGLPINDEKVETGVISVSPDPYNRSAQRISNRVRENEAFKWGMKDDLNWPVFQAYRDHFIAGMSASTSAKSQELTEVRLHRSAIADCYAALKVAQQYQITYPARVIASVRTINAFYNSNRIHTPDTGKDGIRDSIREYTAPALQAAIGWAENMLRNNSAAFLAMSDKKLDLLLNE
jgi:hypothetical protein